MNRRVAGVLGAVAVGGVALLLGWSGSARAERGPAQGSTRQAPRGSVEAPELPLERVAPPPAAVRDEVDGPPTSTPEPPHPQAAEEPPQAQEPELEGIQVRVQGRALRVSGYLPLAQEVPGLRVSVAVSFADTDTPLGFAVLELSPVGALEYELRAESVATLVLEGPGEKRLGAVRPTFPPARYLVEVSLHMQEQHLPVRLRLEREQGYNEIGHQVLAKVTHLHDRAGATLLRVQTLSWAQRWCQSLRAACDEVQPAADSGQAEGLIGAVYEGDRWRTNLRHRLRVYAAVPDQDLLQTAAQAYLELRKLALYVERGAELRRTADGVPTPKDSLTELIQAIEKRLKPLRGGR